MTDIHQPTTGDYAYAVGKGVLGMIPLAGAPAAELLSLIVASPLEKRKQKWLTDVGERLKNLEEEQGIDLAGLSQNEQFIDIVAQATQLAIKTSEQEKIESFKNVIVNSAGGQTSDATKSQIFLHILDGLTAWHIRILHFIDNPRHWFSQAGITPPNSVMGSLSRVIKSAFPDLQGQDELLELIWNDLRAAGFHRSTELRTTMTGEGILANETTELGKEFLQFISK